MWIDTTINSCASHLDEERERIRPVCDSSVLHVVCMCMSTMVAFPFAAWNLNFIYGNFYVFEIFHGVERAHSWTHLRMPHIAIATQKRPSHSQPNTKSSMMRDLILLHHYSFSQCDVRMRLSTRTMGDRADALTFSFAFVIRSKSKSFNGATEYWEKWNLKPETNEPIECHSLR